MTTSVTILPKTSLRSTALILGLVLTNSVCQADSIIEYMIDRDPQGYSVEQRQIMIKDGKVHIGHIAGSSKGDLLFDRSKQTFWYIDHRERRYYEISEENLLNWTRQGRALLGSAKALAQRFNFKFPGQLPDKDNDNAILYQDIGEETVSDVTCRRFSILKGNEPDGDVCMSESGQLNIPKDDYETLLALKQTTYRVNREASDIIATFGVKLPNLGDNKMGGIPIEIHGPQSSEIRTIRLTQAKSAEIDPNFMNIPKNYKLSNLPLPRVR